MPVNTPDAEPAGQALVPLLFGVTGHRDLRDEDLPVLGEKVGAVFREMRAALPGTPFVLLTPLAEGADRLVARVALQAGAGLYVPLPIPRDLYATDFATAESRAEFEELFARAAYTVVMPLAGGSGEADVGRAGEARDRQYEAVGEFVAQHSQVLIALWDGGDGSPIKPGGTAAIVRHLLSELPRESPREPGSRLYPPDPVLSGLVYHVVTPRRGRPAPAGAFEVRRRLPDGIPLEPDARPDDWRRVRAEAEADYGELDEFNRDTAGMSPDERAAVARSRAYLFPDAEEARLPAGLQFTRQCFAAADVLAVRFGRKTLWTHRLIYLLVFLAVVAYEASGHLLAVQALGLVVYPVILAAAGMVYLRAVRFNDFQNNYHDYRVLAEGLRVQFFWRLGGLTEPVEEYYLRRQRRELNWVRQALRTAWFMEGGGVPSPGEASGSQVEGWLVKHWVEDQRVYFTAKARAEEAIEAWYRVGIWVALAAGLVLSVTIGVGLLAPGVFGEGFRRWAGDRRQLEGPLLLLTNLPMILAALLHAYRKGIALGSHLKQYHVIARLFGIASDRLKALTSRPLSAEERLAKVRALVFDLGRESLVENGDWLLLNRDRPLEVPTGR